MAFSNSNLSPEIKRDNKKDTKDTRQLGTACSFNLVFHYQSEDAEKITSSANNVEI